MSFPKLMVIVCLVAFAGCSTHRPLSEPTVAPCPCEAPPITVAPAARTSQAPPMYLPPAGSIASNATPDTLNVSWSVASPASARTALAQSLPNHP